MTQPASSSSARPFKVKKEIRDGEETEETIALQMLRPGGILKNILKGGEAARRAIAELHRRQYHLPVVQMERMLRRANAAVLSPRVASPGGHPGGGVS